jgi:DNA-binding NarL/FixJ family response regulator
MPRPPKPPVPFLYSDLDWMNAVKNKLTMRQYMVLKLISQDASVKEISYALNINQRRISEISKAAQKKLGLSGPVSVYKYLEANKHSGNVMEIA